MLSILLTCVLLLSLFSCQKEYKKANNDNVSTVSNLNKGDQQKVIDEYQNKPQLTGRERYYLASAYAQNGGVDVFSLYSVMEIQLFHKKALEWSDLSKEKNPYLKFMKSQEGIDYEAKLKKREAFWKRYEPEIRKREGMEDKPTLEKIQAAYGSNLVLTQEQYDQADAMLVKKVKEILEADQTDEEKDNQLWNYSDGLTSDPESPLYQNGMGFIMSWLTSWYGDEIRLESMKQNYLHPEKRKDKFSKVQWEMLYMNVLWNTYEAIPVMKKLPTLTDTHQSNLTQSLENYGKLIKDKEFKEVAIKNILVLSAVSLLSIYKSSFDLDNVEGINDLYCSFEPDAVLDNYGLIRERLLFLHRAYKEAGIELKEYKEYEDGFEELKKTVPAELTPDEKERFRKSVDKFKVESCFSA